MGNLPRKVLRTGRKIFHKKETVSTSTPDRREPEYVLYDTPSATLNVYRVKPAVFDLFLSSAIGCYLALVYLLINNSSVIIMFLTGLVKEKEVEMNGHSKSNGVKNGHKLHAY